MKIVWILTFSSTISHYLTGEKKSVLSNNQSPTCALSQSVSTFI